MSNIQRIKLKSFSFQEKNKDHLIFNFLPMNLEDFNLIIGDNAQGKTRLFNVFQFIKGQLGQKRLSAEYNFKANFTFALISDNNTFSEINYQLEISSSNNIDNNYFEKISSKNKIYLCTNKNEPRILLDEIADKKIDNFFIPENNSALSAISGEQFITIKHIKEFFLRMLFIDAKSTLNISLDKNVKFLDPLGINLAGFLSNLSREKPEIYKELISDFKRCFENVEEVSFKKMRFLGKQGPEPEILVFNEKHIKDSVPVHEWSNGMWRLLCILCLPKTPFRFNGHIDPPSIIFIDEIENGLDFKTLKFVIDYLQDYAHEMQILISSHSPSISEFIHPRNWHVIKRKGVNIKITNPQEVEKNLDEDLELFRHKYWDFYTKHISNSNLYEPE